MTLLCDEATLPTCEVVTAWQLRQTLPPEHQAGQVLAADQAAGNRAELKEARIADARVQLQAAKLGCLLKQHFHCFSQRATGHAWRNTRADRLPKAELSQVAQLSAAEQGSHVQSAVHDGQALQRDTWRHNRGKQPWQRRHAGDASQAAQIVVCTPPNACVWCVKAALVQPCACNLLQHVEKQKTEAPVVPEFCTNMQG